MAIRNNKLGGNDWDDGSNLSALDFNDTINAIIDELPQNYNDLPLEYEDFSSKSGNLDTSFWNVNITQDSLDTITATYGSDSIKLSAFTAGTFASRNLSIETKKYIEPGRAVLCLANGSGTSDTGRDFSLNISALGTNLVNVSGERVSNASLSTYIIPKNMSGDYYVINQNGITSVSDVNGLKLKFSVGLDEEMDVDMTIHNILYG